MLLSSKGYGILWNNYGLTEFNPCQHSIKLTKREGAAQQEIVNVTSTEGGKHKLTGRHYEGGQTVTTPVDKAHIPIFIRNTINE